MHDAASQPSTILLIGPDTGFLNAIAGAAGGIHAASVTIVPESVEQAAKRAEIDTAAVIVVDIDPRRRESLIALQGITMRCFSTKAGRSSPSGAVQAVRASGSPTAAVRARTGAPWRIPCAPGVCPLALR